MEEGDNHIPLRALWQLSNKRCHNNSARPDSTEEQDVVSDFVNFFLFVQSTSLDAGN